MRRDELREAEAAFWERIGGDLSTDFVQGQGCNRCGGSGYMERVGLYEVLRVTEGLAERLVSNRSSSEAMRRIAIDEGLSPCATRFCDSLQMGSRQ